MHITFHLSHLPAPALYGPFAYHIHTDPVPANGNCSAAGKHLDPTSAGDATPCDAREPETCQVGDLSGKYGNVTAGAGDGEFVHVVYRDAFLSTDAASAAFVGGRSVVVHLNNGTRFACANLVKCEGGAGGGNGTVGGAGNATMGTGHGGTTTTTTMPSSMSPVATAESTGASEGAPVQTDGAGALTVGGWMVAAGLVGMVL